MRLLPLVLIASSALTAACRGEPAVTVTKRYDSGRIAETRMYVHGVKTGVHRGWWPNGMPQFECRFKDGLSLGTCLEWYADGTLATVHRFQNGVETGLQQGWSLSGAPQFSYDMRNGRRYGLLGALNCKTGVRTGGAL
jgi:antitoxin component YwqK of YwqJK toxin-antitoxin module